MRAQDPAEALISAVFFVFQASIPWQQLVAMSGIILTWVVEVSCQCLEGSMPVLFYSDAFTATAQTVALRQYENWATTDPAFAVFTF